MEVNSFKSETSAPPYKIIQTQLKDELNLMNTKDKNQYLKMH